MEEKKNILTYAGLRQLEDELQDLKVNQRREIAEKIKVAREQGDLSENAEYDAAKDEQRDIEARIEEIEKILKNAEVVVEDEVDSGKINIGRSVPCHDPSRDFHDTLGLLVDFNEAFSRRRLRTHGRAGFAFMGDDGFIQAVDLNLTACKRTMRLRLNDGGISVGVKMDGMGRNGRFGGTCRGTVVGDNRPSPFIGHFNFTVFAAGDC